MCPGKCSVFLGGFPFFYSFSGVSSASQRVSHFVCLRQEPKAAYENICEAFRNVKAVYVTGTSLGESLNVHI